MIQRIILIIITGFALLSACSEPVFRYALKNWRPESYNLIVFYDSELNESDSLLVSYTIEEARTGRLSVLNVTLIDINSTIKNYKSEFSDLLDLKKLPSCILTYPGLKNDIIPIWSGEFNKLNIDKILYSPARKEIANRILNGDAGVWLLIEDINKDNKKSLFFRVLDFLGYNPEDKIFKTINKNLKKINATLKCPASNENDANQPVDDSVSVKFSTYRLSADNIEEEIFIRILSKLNNKTIEKDGTLIFPIFGRGRTLPPIAGDELNKDVIYDVAKFLTGPCACIVKAENPGVDILFTVTWVNRKTNYEVFALIEETPLKGIGDFARKDTENINVKNYKERKREYQFVSKKDWLILSTGSLMFIVLFVFISVSIIKNKKNKA